METSSKIHLCIDSLTDDTSLLLLIISPLISTLTGLGIFVFIFFQRFDFLLKFWTLKKKKVLKKLDTEVLKIFCLINELTFISISVCFLSPDVCPLVPAELFSDISCSIFLLYACHLFWSVIIIAFFAQCLWGCIS